MNDELDNAAEPVPVAVPSEPDGVLIAHDFDVPDVPVAATPSAPVPEPLVIVQKSRRRGWWSPWVLPLLIVSLALASLAYRPAIRTWSWSEPTSHAPAPVVKSAPDPVVVKVQAVPAAPVPAPTAPLEPAAPPPLAAALPRPEPERLRPPPPATPPPASAPAAVPAPAPAPPVKPAADETQLALEQIRQEARRNRVEKAEAAKLMDQVDELEEERRLDALRAVDHRRAAFQAELRQLLNKYGDRAGRYIYQLAKERATEPAPDVDRAVHEAMKQYAGRIDHRVERVKLLRRCGSRNRASSTTCSGSSSSSRRPAMDPARMRRRIFAPPSNCWKSRRPRPSSR